MKSGLSIIAVFCVLGLSAQTSKFSYGLRVSPGWSGDFGTSSIRSKLCVGSSVFGSYAFNKRLQVQSGLGYVNYGAVIPDRELIYAVPSPDAPQYYKARFNEHLLEVPLLLQVYVFKRLYVRGGLSWWRLMHATQRHHYTYQDGTVDRSKQVLDYPGDEKSSFNANLSVGGDLRVTDGYRFFVEVGSRFGELNLRNEVRSLRRLYGITVGVALQ